MVHNVKREACCMSFPRDGDNKCDMGGWFKTSCKVSCFFYFYKGKNDIHPALHG